MNTGAAHTPETLFIFFDIFGRVSAVVEVTPNRRVFAPIGERVGRVGRVGRVIRLNCVCGGWAVGAITQNQRNAPTAQTPTCAWFSHGRIR